MLDPGKKLNRRVVAKAPLRNARRRPRHGRAVPAGEDRCAIRKGQYVGADGADVGAGDAARPPRRHVVALEPRRSGCSDYTTQFGLLGKRTSAFFRCLYKSVRLTYSATFISSPQAPEK